LKTQSKSHKSSRDVYYITQQINCLLLSLLTPDFAYCKHPQTYYSAMHFRHTIFTVIHV